MPDILIRGMEYPKSCSRCDFASVVPGEVWCKRAKEIVPEEQTISGNRPTFCPLHELPPHGDLISRDEAVSVLQSIGSRDYRREKGTICDAIKMISHSQYVPTIVPASEEATNDPQP